MKQKTAVMIYPFFSLQEITCLTSCLKIWEEREIDTYASSKAIVKSEEGFQVTANKTFEEFEESAYDCLILPGILNPMPALFDAANIRFLETLAGKDILIASISSSPLLLAKAGLLKDKKFTVGIFEEMYPVFPFVPKENLVRTPVCKDGNLITAVGFAFKEFAIQTLRALGIECRDDVLDGVYKEFTEEELTFRMGEEGFKEFLDEYNKYLPQ